MPLAKPTHALEDAIGRLEHLQVFPDAALRIHRVARESSASLGSMERAVSMDPALAGRLLKIANSSFYGLNKRVDSVRRAVQLLGFYPTRDLALALAVGSLGKQGTALSRLAWERSLFTAVGMQHIARYIRNADRNQAFVTGLLHDIGAMLLLELEPEAYAPLFKTFHRQGANLVRAEQFQLGYSHAQLAGEVLRRWNLPDDVATSVAEHHALPPVQVGYRPKLHPMLVLAQELTERVATTRPQDLTLFAARHPMNQILRVHPKNWLTIVTHVLIDAREFLEAV